MTGDRLRILHVVPFFPPHLGGMEQRTFELACEQARRGHDITVLTSAEPGLPASEDTGEGFRIERVPIFSPARTLPLLPTLGTRLRRLPTPAVWQVGVSHAFFVEQVALAARSRGQAFIAQMHIDPQRTTRLGVFLGPYKRALLGPALRAARAVVSPTKGYSQRVAGVYGLSEDKVQVIPPGNRFEVPIPRDLRAGDAELRLLTVGRLAPEKNLELMLRAMRQMTADREFPEVSLTVVGDGPSQASLSRAVAEMGLGSRVHLAGRLDGPDLEAAYRQADVFLMTSSEESFGCVIPEAMAHGLPVIVPDIDGPRDIVTDGVSGLIVGHDASQIAAAVGRVAREPDLHRRLVAGGEELIPRYAWRAVADRWEDLYRRVGAASSVR